MKLALKYNEVINGEFVPGSTNLIMAFQVNCPGCFIYGFPLLKKLQTQYDNKLSCFALATAFEDFHLNSTENVKRLINTDELVGETLKAQKAGLLKWDNAPISVPVLIDEVANQTELLHPEFIENTIQNFDRTTATEQENMRTTLHNHFSQLPQCGKTFAANLMRGTPSFFLFTDSMEILAQWFGHADSRVIKKELDIFINKKHG